MIGFPLLLIPFAIYNIFVFMMPGVAFTAPIVSVALMSGVTWSPTFGDALLAFGMLLLLLEVIKASRPGGRYLTDHLLSLIVFGAAVAEFLLLPQFATSTFVLLAVLTGVEFLSGVSLGIRNRRRHVQAPAPVAQTPAPVAVPVAQPEPAFERKHQDLRPEDLRLDESRPVEPTFIPPEPEAKPVPSLAVIRDHETTAPVGTSPVGERKIVDWNVSDLVSGTDAKPHVAPKP